MGMYGDLLHKIDTNQFIKLEPNHPIKLRLLDHPWISQQEFVDKQTGETRIVTRFTWPVWDYEQERVRILSQGKSVFEQIANAAESWPGGDTMPSPFDLVIKRTGTGQFDTEYVVNAVPYGGIMPTVKAADLPDMEEKSKGIPVQQILQGKKPPVIAATNKPAALPEPSIPTHEQAEALTKDTVVEIPEGQVGLDDIPF